MKCSFDRGKRMFVWQAVNGEVLDIIVRQRRNNAAVRELGCKDSTWRGGLQDKRAESVFSCPTKRENPAELPVGCFGGARHALSA